MDQNGQPNQPISYVDDYAPPAAKAQNVPNSSPAASNAPAGQNTQPGQVTYPKVQHAQSPFAMLGDNVTEPHSESGMTQPPVYKPQATQAAPTSAAVPKSSQAVGSENSEALEDQNIFVMLGIDQIPEKEKESFLDELQQVIWEDFVENDTKLLLTQEEYSQFSALANKTYANENEKQGTLIDFVEKLIPDLEKIMLEKALELKEEMFRERVKELQRSKPDMAEKLKQVDAAMAAGKWFTASSAINRR